jgi:hypothetical protein
MKKDLKSMKTTKLEADIAVKKDILKFLKSGGMIKICKPRKPRYNSKTLSGARSAIVRTV